MCNGNIHRSVIAEMCLANILKLSGQASKYKTASYGLQGTMGTAKPLHKNLREYTTEWKAAASALCYFNIDITKHRYRKITRRVLQNSAVVIAMDKKVYSQEKNSLLKQFPDQKNKIHLFSKLTKNHKEIKDPSGISSTKVHQATIKNIYLTIKNKSGVILNWTK